MALNRFLRGSCLALLLGMSVNAFAPWILRKVFIWAHTPDSSQQKFHPTHGPFLNANLVRGELPVPVFTTDSRIDWLEKDFKHRDGDVYVTTYAKVGTTWTQYMVSLLTGHQPGSTIDLFKNCPWPEADFGLPATGRDELQTSASTPGPPRCFKSHWWNRDHMDIGKLPATSKVIFVYRDAESVFNSLFHHIFHLYGFYQVVPEDFPEGKAWDTLFEMFMAGELEYGDYMEHLAGWWKARNRPNVLVIRFDDIKKHHVDTIRNISKFIGMDANESMVEFVRHHSSFAEMKKGEEGDMFQKVGSWAGVFRGSHIRAGGKKEKSPFTPEQLDRLQRRYEEVLQPLGMPREWILSHKRD